ncbi:metal-dependent hydrolase [Paenibacillus hemerocallicola]|uniref:Metal-dependent hydrolase n=1 Tax=Paenibacillus hemerocallicola TaxID=1172614 RepID=A0A5C4T0X4_9BACL|nr:metal-dependent hydrolase [Paenibacillus hemerocallicola]TNJ61887.1 metal-dependent hydrolase [Paenibacillus hemerocallicola]
MDTGSHLTMGLTLAGLAYLDPAVAHNPDLAQAVLIGTIVGSNAPDFDSVFRLRGFSFYIRYHRGITHSIPALFIWPALLSSLLYFAYPSAGGWLHLYLWSFIATVLHVFLDLLNVYGVQCMRPVHKKWLHLDILTIFEPFLFVVHAFGLVLWLAMGYDPAAVFSWVYALSFGYIGLRAGHHCILLRQVKRFMGVEGIYHVLPDVIGYKWSFVVETESSFYTGKIVFGDITVEQQYAKQEKNEVVQATMATDGVRAFLAFAQRVHVSWTERLDGYEVVWSEVRFWYDRKLPFGVVVRLNRDLQVVDTNLGWRKKAWSPPYV